MKAAISGIGWITPLGADLDALRAGGIAETKPISNPESGEALPARPVPPKLVEHLARNPFQSHQLLCRGCGAGGPGRSRRA